MKTGKSRSIALALTWDGARWPVGALPPKARAFLHGASGDKSLPSTGGLAGLLAADQISEMRICWVPRLKGGEGVLSAPLVTPDGKRLAFRAAGMARFGDVLGIRYRRKRGMKVPSELP